MQEEGCYFGQWLLLSFRNRIEECVVWAREKVIWTSAFWEECIWFFHQRTRHRIPQHKNPFCELFCAKHQSGIWVAAYRKIEIYLHTYRKIPIHSFRTFSTSGSSSRYFFYCSFKPFFHIDCLITPWCVCSKYKH